MTLSRTGTLKRKTPLRRTELARGTSQLRRAPLERGEPIKRTKPMRRASPRRLKRRAKLAPFVRFVKHLPCIHCHRKGPSDPAHMTLGPNEKGTSLKVGDDQVVPLCRSCHQYFDGNADGPRNPFRGFTKDQRYELAAEWVRLTIYATIPEDRNSASELERWGLGRVVEHEGGETWHWEVGSSA